MSFKEIMDFLKKHWATKQGLAVSCLVFFYIAYKVFTSIFGKLSCDILCLYFLLFCVFVVGIYYICWCSLTGRIRLPWINRISIAIHPNILTPNNNLEVILKTIIKEGNLGRWFDVFTLPSDFPTPDAQTVEQYLLRQRVHLVVWGHCITGNESGKPTAQYNINFSYAFFFPIQKELLRQFLLRQFNQTVRERYWKVCEENSLKEISVLGENIAEVGTYIVAICLLTFADINRGLPVLERLHLRLSQDPAKKKMVIYSHVRNQLISLYNWLSVNAWTNKKDRAVSRMWADKTLALDDNNYDCHARLALLDYLDGNPVSSKKHVKRCRNIDANHPCTRYDQAFYFLLEKRYESALKRYKKIAQGVVDGLLAQEVAVFLDEEYEKHHDVALLFAAGLVNCQFVGHKELGQQQLEKFISLASGKPEYDILLTKGKAILKEI